MFDTILPAVLPHILEIVSLLIMLVITYMAKKLRDWTGIQIERAHAQTLHSALMTGVRHALERHLPNDQVAAHAARWAETIGAPDAVKAFGLGQTALETMARAKMHETATSVAATPAK